MTKLKCVWVGCGEKFNNYKDRASHVRSCKFAPTQNELLLRRNIMFPQSKHKVV